MSATCMTRELLSGCSQHMRNAVASQPLHEPGIYQALSAPGNGRRCGGAVASAVSTRNEKSNRK